MSVSDEELADMEARLNGACSLCGAQAGVNIDCGLCEELDREERLIAALREERERSGRYASMWLSANKDALAMSGAMVGAAMGMPFEDEKLEASVRVSAERITQLEAELAEATRPFAQQRENWLNEIRRQKEKKASAYNRIAELEAERDELRAEVSQQRACIRLCNKTIVAQGENDKERFFRIVDLENKLVEARSEVERMSNACCFRCPAMCPHGFTTALDKDRKP